MTQDFPEIMGPDQAASFLGLDKVVGRDGRARKRPPERAIRSLYRLVERGQVRARRIGKNLRFVKSELLEDVKNMQ